MKPRHEDQAPGTGGRGAPGPARQTPARQTDTAHPRLAVFSTLFPNAAEPNAGLFIRERMFRVGRTLPLVVVAPVPWFPFQGLIRRFRPHFRPPVPRIEHQNGFAIHHPRFLSVPGLFKSLDGLLLALGTWPLMKRLKREFGFDIIDAHFAYPDGYGAGLLGRWLGVPLTITLRGTEARLVREPWARRRITAALGRATRIFAVSGSLLELAAGLGIARSKLRVMANGVDTAKFTPEPRARARSSLSLPGEAPVLVSVGALVERKGFHRVIDCLPALRRRFPGLQYLMVGGASPEGDMTAVLREQVQRLGLEDTVRFVGPLAPERLRIPLSAADVFVLATRNEGWANVFLEAMACGLPVVTTDVGGNREVVARDELGTVVEFGDHQALCDALARALSRQWDRQAIQAYARANSWETRIDALTRELVAVHTT